MKKFFNFVIGCVAGLVLGPTGAFIQANRTLIGGIRIPTGCIFALSLILVTQLWLTRATQSRLTAIGIAFIWVFTTLYAGGEFGNSDENVIAPTWYSKLYVFGGAILVGLISAFPILKPIPESNSLEEPFNGVMQAQQDQRNSGS